MRFFFYGTLRDADVLESVLGRPVPTADVRAASLRDHRAVAVTGDTYPVAVPQPGAVMPGIVVSGLDAGDEARLHHYEGSGYDLAHVTVDLPTGRGIGATMFVPHDGIAHDDRDWRLEDWTRGSKAEWLRRMPERLRDFTPLDPALGRGDVTVEQVEVAYKGHFRIDRYRVRHKLFAGGASQPIRREVLERGHAVAVLPYDPVRDEVVLIRQFRIGAFAGHGEPWMIEIVAGIIDAGEKAEAVGLRELKEEAGLVPLAPLRHILTCHVSPGGTTETFELYVARVDATGTAGIHGLPEEGEDIQVLVWPFTRAWRALSDGLITASPAIMALQWLALNRERLRAGVAGAQS